jgi:hypothetical protein
MQLRVYKKFNGHTGRKKKTIIYMPKTGPDKKCKTVALG